MVLILCVDDRFGMRFNRRRQSSDQKVIEKILELSAGRRLWMNGYSRMLFPENASIYVCEDPIQKSADDDYCFVEDVDVSSHMNRVEKIILFHWNRKYPSDLYFPDEELKMGWKLERSFDFAGSSHQRITMEVYSR